MTRVAIDADELHEQVDHIVLHCRSGQGRQSSQLGMVCQKLGAKAPAYVAVRNVSDPEISSDDLSLAEQTKLAADIYKEQRDESRSSAGPLSPAFISASRQPQHPTRRLRATGPTSGQMAWSSSQLSYFPATLSCTPLERLPGCNSAFIQRTMSSAVLSSAVASASKNLYRTPRASPSRRASLSTHESSEWLLPSEASNVVRLPSISRSTAFGRSLVRVSNSPLPSGSDECDGSLQAQGRRHL